MNELVSVANSLNENLLHRDGADATVDGDPAPSFMRGDLDMGDDPFAPVNHKVINMADGTNPADAVTKQQLNALSSFLTGLQTQLNGALKTDGTNAMLAAMNMGAQRIEFMAEPINVADAVTKNYHDTAVATVNTTFVKTDGTNTMIGNLDMGGFKVVNLNLAVPTSDGDGVSRSYLLQVLSDIAATPPGAIVPYAGLNPPTGWFLCDGDTVSETTFANLFAVIGTTYNTGGEPGGEFRLPDMRGRLPVGLDNMGGASAGVLTDAQADILGGTLGFEDHTLVTAELPLHSHQYDDQYIAVTTGGAETGPSVTNLTSTFTEEVGRTTSSTGSDTAHNNVQPVIAMNFIIKN
ncbi:MAG TPA: tail fiber protein [Planctomycetota bacterium]|nr:tail fiber protein [Planctomycetota bacterium]